MYGLHMNSKALHRHVPLSGFDKEQLRKEVNEILPTISKVTTQAVQAFSNGAFAEGRLLAVAIVKNADALREVFEDLEVVDD